LFLIILIINDFFLFVVLFLFNILLSVLKYFILVLIHSVHVSLS